jgi:hypothetical protein
MQHAITSFRHFAFHPTPQSIIARPRAIRHAPVKYLDIRRSPLPSHGISPRRHGDQMTCPALAPARLSLMELGPSSFQDKAMESIIRRLNSARQPAHDRTGSHLPVPTATLWPCITGPGREPLVPGWGHPAPKIKGDPKAAPPGRAKNRGEVAERSKAAHPALVRIRETVSGGSNPSPLRHVP